LAVPPKQATSPGLHRMCIRGTRDTSDPRSHAVVA